VSLRELLARLTGRAREPSSDFAGANERHGGDYTDETTAARTQHGLYGSGGAPPGYVKEYDEGRPKK
jgi:hypothetical protein